jgi:hypothetical protein
MVGIVGRLAPLLSASVLTSESTGKFAACP